MKKKRDLPWRFAAQHREKLKLLRTPNGLDSWEPSCPIVKAYKGANAVHLKSALSHALSSLQTIPLTMFAEW